MSSAPVCAFRLYSPLMVSSPHLSPHYLHPFCNEQITLYLYPHVTDVPLTACTISYKFTGTSINYDLIKTIQIDKIANRAPYGWAPMEAMFNNQLQDQYVNQTRLKLVKRGGDLRIAGEITGYDQFNKAISAGCIFFAGTVEDDCEHPFCEQQDQSKLGKAILSHFAVRLELAAHCGSGRPGQGNDERHLRPDIQCHGGRLVVHSNLSVSKPLVGKSLIFLSVNWVIIILMTQLICYKRFCCKYLWKQ